MFVSLYVCFLVYFMVLWVIFSIYALLFLLHRVFVLDMHTSLCYCVSLNACSDDHLLCYVIIVVISIWLFWCIIKLLKCFTSCLLDRNLLVTLYLSFYYLLYIEGLMYFVQVFQVIGIYVPGSSQLLWLIKWGVLMLKSRSCLCLMFCLLLSYVLVYIQYCVCSYVAFVSF